MQLTRRHVLLGLLARQAARAGSRFAHRQRWRKGNSGAACYKAQVVALLSAHTRAVRRRRRTALVCAERSATTCAKCDVAAPGATSTASHKMRRSTPVREQTFAYKAGAAFASKNTSMEVKVAVVKKTLAHLSPRALRHWRAAMANVNRLQAWVVGNAMPQGLDKALWHNASNNPGLQSIDIGHCSTPAAQ